mgnify:CR=1 FL=1
MATEENEEKLSIIDALPSEVIVLIMSFLPPKNLVLMDRVCKYVRYRSSAFSLSCSCFLTFLIKGVSK